MVPLGRSSWPNSSSAAIPAGCQFMAVLLRSTPRLNPRWTLVDLVPLVPIIARTFAGACFNQALAAGPHARCAGQGRRWPPCCCACTVRPPGTAAHAAPAATCRCVCRHPAPATTEDGASCWWTTMTTGATLEPRPTPCCRLDQALSRAWRWHAPKRQPDTTALPTARSFTRKHVPCSTSFWSSPKSPNTGNVIRLAANTGCTATLIEPLGFSMERPTDAAQISIYHEYARCCAILAGRPSCAPHSPTRCACTRSPRMLDVNVHDACFLPGDWLVFGAETARPAPVAARDLASAQQLRLPMVPGQRSLEPLNAVAVTGVRGPAAKQAFDGRRSSRRR